MFNFKSIVIAISGFVISFCAFSEEIALPQKTNIRGNQIDCGSKTDMNLERTLEKIGPEIVMDAENSESGKLTAGITGYTVSGGAKITDESLANLIIGKTTYQDIVRQFGKPTATVRNDHIFIVTYTFLLAESKIDPKIFIPIFGSILAKNSYKTNQRQAQIHFHPETGILTSCTKTDNITESQGESTFDGIKRLRIE